VSEKRRGVFKKNALTQYGVGLYRVGGIGRKRPSISRGFCGVHQSVTPKATLSKNSTCENGKFPRKTPCLENDPKLAAADCDKLHCPFDVSEDALRGIAEYPALARVVKAWPGLPPHIRETISNLLDAVSVICEMREGDCF